MVASPLIRCPSRGRFVPLVLAFFLAAAASPAETLLEDRFDSGGGSGSESVDMRLPQVGSPWSGNCAVEGGRGLVHTGEGRGQVAYTALSLPSDCKALVVTIRIRPKRVQQFAFGFANNAPDLARAEKTLFNTGVMWVNTTASKAWVRGGLYCEGQSVAAGPVFIPDRRDEVAEMTFRVQVTPPGPYRCDLEVGAKTLISEDMTATEQPRFNYFFIQFRPTNDERAPDEQGSSVPTTEVESVVVTAE
jgi:hypothetical protein